MESIIVSFLSLYIRNWYLNELNKYGTKATVKIQDVFEINMHNSLCGYIVNNNIENKSNPFHYIISQNANDHTEDVALPAYNCVETCYEYPSVNSTGVMIHCYTNKSMCMTGSDAGNIIDYLCLYDQSNNNKRIGQQATTKKCSHGLQYPQTCENDDNYTDIKETNNIINEYIKYECDDECGSFCYCFCNVFSDFLQHRMKY